MASLLFGGALAAGGLYALKKWSRGGHCEHFIDLHDKTAVVTGANTGVGKATAIALARMGARVIIACRDQAKMDKALSEIRRKTASPLVEGVLLDLADTDSIRKCSEELHSRVTALHLLINNAGVMASPGHLRTKQGLELQMGTNHLGHFLFTSLLLDLLKAAAPARIVNLSSLAHQWAKRARLDDLMWQNTPYDPNAAYCLSKLAIVMATAEMNRRLHGTGVTANAVHPGFVRTELGRHMSVFQVLNTALYPFLYLISKSEEEGAQTSIYAAIAPELEGVGGKYLADCKVTAPNPLVTDEQLCRRLWSESEKLLGITFST